MKSCACLDGRVLENAVAEIQDVACAAERCDGFLRGAANCFGRAEEDGWVDIALHGDLGPRSGRRARKSTRQSTLRTFAPERATAGSR